MTLQEEIAAIILASENALSLKNNSDFEQAHIVADTIIKIYTALTVPKLPNPVRKNGR